MLAVWDQWIKKITNITTNCGLFQVAVFMYYEIQFWTDEVAQQAKASAPKCDKLNSVRGAHMVNEEELLPKVVLSPPDVCHGTHPSFPHSLHKINEWVWKIVLREKSNIVKMLVLPD